MLRVTGKTLRLAMDSRTFVDLLQHRKCLRKGRSSIALIEFESFRGDLFPTSLRLFLDEFACSLSSVLLTLYQEWLPLFTVQSSDYKDHTLEERGQECCRSGQPIEATQSSTIDCCPERAEQCINWCRDCRENLHAYIQLL